MKQMGGKRQRSGRPKGTGINGKRVRLSTTILEVNLITMDQLRDRSTRGKYIDKLIINDGLQKVKKL